MSLTPAQAQQLKTELTTDPKGYGYALTTNQDALAALLNQVRAGEPQPQTVLTTRTLVAAIVPAEFNTIMGTSEATTGQIRAWYLQVLASAGSVDLSNGNVQAALTLIFPQASCPTTFAAVQALYTRPGSRAESLFGAGAVVQSVDISLALAA